MENRLSMRRYFYRIKTQLLIIKVGIPVKFGFVTGTEQDLKKLSMELPTTESDMFVDLAYINYDIEDQLMRIGQIALKVHRKSNAKRKTAKVLSL